MTTCPDCDRELFGDRCSCGYVRKEASISHQREFITRYCITDGCEVRIRHEVGRAVDPVCKWCVERAEKGFPHKSYAKRFEANKGKKRHAA